MSEVTPLYRLHSPSQVSIFKLRNLLGACKSWSWDGRSVSSFCFFFLSSVASSRVAGALLSKEGGVSLLRAQALVYSLASRPSLGSVDSASVFFFSTPYQFPEAGLAALGAQAQVPESVILLSGHSAGSRSSEPRLSRVLAPISTLESPAKVSLARGRPGVYSYFTGWASSTYTSIFFLRASSLYNKSRYSRNRQTYRTGAYLCMWLTVISVVGLYYYFYVFLIKFTYLWSLFYIVILCFFLYYFKSRSERH